MLKEVMLTMAVLFTFPIPLIPVMLYHVVKGIVSDVRRWIA